jgi:hypothetical protein
MPIEEHIEESNREDGVAHVFNDLAKVDRAKINTIMVAARIDDEDRILNIGYATPHEQCEIMAALFIGLIEDGHIPSVVEAMQVIALKLVKHAPSLQ